MGPRMTGKTTLLERIPAALRLDLLVPENERLYRTGPERLWAELQVLKPKQTVIIDEVQRIPALLDYVQLGIQKKDLRFILSGSSARKLKRGGANLLGGRAAKIKLHPLTTKELKGTLSIDQILSFGSLPKIAQLVHQKELDEARRVLKSYYSLYVKEEVQAEALVRNLAAFERFLAIAAQSNGTIIEYLNIGYDCQVPDNTVKEYFLVLEDTLLGHFLWPFDGSERKKRRPKFYFFDCGVLRAIQMRLTDPPGFRERGNLFETFMVNEFIRICDYLEREHIFTTWRERDHEVDLLIQNSRGIIMAMEFKSSEGDFSTSSLRAFRKRLPKVPLIVASLIDRHERKTDDGFHVMPWQQAIDLYWSGI